MKILLLYTPRSGSTSILKYFEKIKTEYECFNEPWFGWMVENVHKNENEYSDLITKENIFVKSAYKTLPVSLNILLNDFDKIVILLRKNQKEQVESSIIVHKEESFLNIVPRNYNLYNITDDEFQTTYDRYSFLNETLNNFATLNNLPIFYYEDLYYGNFNSLFNELEIEYNELYYKEFLDTTNKYRIGDIVTKKTNSLI
jgi:hypothetical protein